MATSGQANDETEDETDEAGRIHELNRRQRDVFIVGWISFLCAAAATMVFFAFVDPLALADITEPPLPVERMGGYALGFFFFWTLGAASAALTVYLIRTRHGHPPPGS